MTLFTPKEYTQDNFQCPAWLYEIVVTLENLRAGDRLSLARRQAEW